MCQGVNLLCSLSTPKKTVVVAVKKCLTKQMRPWARPETSPSLAARVTLRIGCHYNVGCYTRSRMRQGKRTAHPPARTCVRGKQTPPPP